MALSAYEAALAAQDTPMQRPAYVEAERVGQHVSALITAGATRIEVEDDRAGSGYFLITDNATL